MFRAIGSKRMSRKSVADRCDSCGDILRHGDWPFCRGKGSHGSVFGLRAQRFDPVVYFEDTKTHEKIIPPGNDVDVPSGYMRKTASTLPEVRQLTKYLDQQSKERFYRYHAKRLGIKRESIERNLEFALRAREKMSDPLAMKLTDVAIERMKDQRKEQMPTFQPSGHFFAFENDNLRQQR